MHSDRYNMIVITKKSILFVIGSVREFDDLEGTMVGGWLIYCMICEEVRFSKSVAEVSVHLNQPTALLNTLVLRDNVNC